MSNKTKITISRDAFFSLISQEKRGCFVHVKMRTEPSDILKTSKVDGETNPYYKGIKKVTEQNFRLLPDYEKRVKSNLVKEGKNPDDFSSEPMKGKKHVSPNTPALVSEKDESVKYIMLEFFKRNKPKVRYEYQGNTIEKIMFEKWISDRTAESNSKQNLSNTINVRTPKLENVFSITYKGVIYELID